VGAEDGFVSGGGGMGGGGGGFTHGWRWVRSRPGVGGG
jgi:hypothetical protein